MRTELPVAAYALFPAQAAVARREGHAEWSAPCPFCGGEDRFHIFAGQGGKGDRYWCRVCGRKGFMDGKQWTPEQKAGWVEKQRVQREREREEREERTKRLTEAAYWRGYHDALRDVGRAEWRKRGLPDEAQEWFEVGYTTRDHHPALAIPFHNREWAVETVQYRLLDVDGRGKYRFETGYPATSYWTRPATEGWPYIVCEGAIKSAVLFWQLVVELNRPYNVVAISSKTPGRQEIERLGEEVGDAPVYLLLDPDATAQERERVGVHFNTVRYVSLPGKVDDLLTGGIVRPEQIETIYLAQATRTVVA